MRNHSLPSGHDLLRRIARRTQRYDFTVWFWGDAIAIDGLLDAAEWLDDQELTAFCETYYTHWAERPLSWVDHLTPGDGLLRLYERMHDASFLEAAQRLAEWLMGAPRSLEGTPFYRPDLPPYRHTVWVDTLYHEPVFFAHLAQITGENRWYNVALEIWHRHVDVLIGDTGPLLAHAYDAGAQKRRGYGWGRGNGWALLGLIDTLAVLPTDHADYPSAMAEMRRLGTAILHLQDASGFWRTLLQDRESYLESSTAAFFGAAFTKGVRLGLLDASFAEAAERAWEATKSRLSDDGGFYGVSACTYAAVTPDDDITMYRTLPTEVNVWGQGAALRFLSERLHASKELER